MTPPPSCSRDRAAIAARARDGFRAAFGSEAGALAFAPGRVNLIGDHTDYADGLVMPMAIGWGCVAAGAPGRPGRLRLRAIDLDDAAELDIGRPLEPGDQAPVGSWASMVGGVFEGMRRALASADAALLDGLDIAITCDVPNGGGLSSSAAVEVSTATLIEAIAGVRLDPATKARICQRAEHEFVGMPCGIMDQLISITGRADHAVLIDCRSLSTTPIPLPSPERAVVLALASRVSHRLSESEYPRRVAACRAAADVLTPGRGIGGLRDVTLEQLDASPLARERIEGAVTERDAAMHVISENIRVARAAETAADGDVEGLGRLMSESHRSLSDLYRVSCAEVDELQRIAIAQPGTYGARMTGGGFGGFVVVLADAASADRVASETRRAYLASRGLDCQPITLLAGDGAAVLPIP